MTTSPVSLTASSLYDLEQDLQALLDTEGLIPEDQHAIFNAELEHALATTVAKRDRCGEFLKHCEAQADLAQAESTRLRKRAEIFTNAAERMRGYIRNVIQVLGADAKGKHKRLEGEKFTFSLRKAPESVQIAADAIVPQKYTNVTLTLRADAIAMLFSALEEYLPGTPEGQLAEYIRLQIGTAKSAPDKQAIKQALASGEQIKGVTLERGPESVVVA